MAALALSVTLSSLLVSPQGGELSKPTVHQGTLLVTAAHVFVSAEKVLENSAILIRNGKVLYVGDEIPEDAKKVADKVAFPKGTVVPGMVNPHSSLGHGANLAEKIDTFTPELHASDAFDPFVDGLLESARAGITTVGLAPSSLNAFAGQGTAVHTGKIGRILVESTYLKMSMIDAAFDQNRFPTSRMGAADLIRRTFKQARSVIGPTDGRLKVLHDVVTGGRRLAFRVQKEAEIDAVLTLSEELTIKPLLVGCEEGDKCVDRIARLSAGVMLAALDFSSPEKRTTLPGRLEKLGVPFSFMAERAESLRISGALAVRHGASRKAVLSALTKTAAAHAEASGQTGTLHEGKSADFCVFSGHPLDLSSQLLAVYVAGVAIETQDKAR